MVGRRSAPAPDSIETDGEALVRSALLCFVGARGRFPSEVGTDEQKAAVIGAVFLKFRTPDSRQRR